jgi:hypothetical protein
MAPAISRKFVCRRNIGWNMRSHIFWGTKCCVERKWWLWLSY